MKIRSRRGRCILLWALGLLASFTFADLAASQELERRSDPVPPSSDPAVPRPLERPIDLISSTRLNPPLRSDTFLRFSSDGAYLFIQDQAGIFLLAHQPLRILLYADIGNASPAAFSADSQAVSVLGRDLILTTWQLSNPNRPQRRELPVQHGCLDAKLSPDAAWVACFTPDFVLDLYRTDDLQRVFSQRLGSKPFGPVMVPIARNHDTPFSRPLGFMANSDFSALADRGTFRSTVHFAPAAKFLLVYAESASFRLELPSLSKSNLPGALRKMRYGVVGFPSEDRILVSDSEKDTLHQILSLSSGNSVGAVSFTADAAHFATNPRFVLLAKVDSAGVSGIFDFEKNRLVDVAPNLGVDVFGDELALLTPEGQFRLYHLGEERPSASGLLPLGPIPRLQTALADSSLSTLILSARGAGGAYDLATGNRLAGFQSLEGASFASPDSAFLVTPWHGKASSGVLHWAKEQSPGISPAWVADKATELFSSRGALISYSFPNETGVFAPVIGPNGEVLFQLRGLEPSTGRKLWHRPFNSDSPVAFSDPQGDRIVLGWKAHTGPAVTVARRFPAAREAFKKTKLKDQDAFFEVLDAASGNSLGGVLVQFGSGPASFDSAFSVGNFLVLSKDAYRITVFRLNEGTLLGRFRGIEPALSDAAKLLALDDTSGKLMLYSLETGAKVAERRMPDYVNYLCFSEKGDRLLVLTSHQTVYILDVKKTIASFPPPANEPVSEPVP